MSPVRSPAGEKPNAAAVFKSVDSDEDGAITADEFKTAMDTLREQRKSQPDAANGMGRPSGPPPGGMRGAGGPPPSAEEEAEEVFDDLDTNKDGTVSIEELMASLVEESESNGGTAAVGQADELKKLFEAVDGDGDGSISKAELTTVFEDIRKRAEEDLATRAEYRTDGTANISAPVGENLSVTA